jgi:hypothetical protein
MISSSIVGANPQAIEARVKVLTPMENIRRRP